MKTSYGVVWREGEAPVAAGKLELLPRELRLEGRDGIRVIPYDRLSAVRIGRTARDRLSGQPSVVVEHSGGEPVTIATVAQPSLVSEIAERLAAFQLDSPRMARVVAVLPLRPGSREAVRKLLEDGPPFDPAEIEGLERHEVFLSADEVVFLFQSQAGPDALVPLLTRPELWQALAEWREHIDGPPRIAEEAFSWVSIEEPANVSYLSTPGPGDSDGGDIF